MFVLKAQFVVAEPVTAHVTFHERAPIKGASLTVGRYGSCQITCLEVAMTQPAGGGELWHIDPTPQARLEKVCTVLIDDVPVMWVHESQRAP